MGFRLHTWPLWLTKRRVEILPTRVPYDSPSPLSSPTCTLATSLLLFYAKMTDG